MDGKLLIFVLFSAVFAAETAKELGAPVSRLSQTQTWDCGTSSSLFKIHTASINPSPILYPGDVTMDVDMEVLEDVPSENLMVRLFLEKLEPFRMLVPCFQGIGSCAYDVCSSVIPNNKDAFCKMGACQCPFTKKRYLGSKVPYSLPDMGGALFAQILAGSFMGNITFYNSVTDRVYGCMGMSFIIKANP